VPVVLVHGGVWRHQYGRDTMESWRSTRLQGPSDMEYRLPSVRDQGWPARATSDSDRIVPQLAWADQAETDTGRGYLSMWASSRAEARIERGWSWRPW
jgi:hypothetical protein